MISYFRPAIYTTVLQMEIDRKRAWYFISQLLTLLGFVFFSLVIFQFVALLAVKMLQGVDYAGTLEIIGAPQVKFPDANVTRIFIMITNLGSFAIPAIVYLRVYRYPMLSTLRLNRWMPWWQLALVVVFAVAVLFGVSLISDWNHAIPFPDAIMEKIKLAKEKNDALIESMLLMPNVPHLLFSILAMALAPALGEEFLFRGILQPLFKNWTKSIHWGIVISAAVFSAIHFDFQDFISRFAIAVAYGYLFYWSGNLWITILAHFLNNSFDVLVYYFKDSNAILHQMAEQEHTPVIYGLVSIGIIGLILWLFQRSAQAKEEEAAAG